MERQQSKLLRQTNKLKPKEFKIDYTINYDLFQVVRDGNIELLDRLLEEQRRCSDHRYNIFGIVNI